MLESKSELFSFIDRLVSLSSTSPVFSENLIFLLKDCGLDISGPAGMFEGVEYLKVKQSVTDVDGGLVQSVAIAKEAEGAMFDGVEQEESGRISDIYIELHEGLITLDDFISHFGEPHATLSPYPDGNPDTISMHDAARWWLNGIHPFTVYTFFQNHPIGFRLTLADPAFHGIRGKFELMDEYLEGRVRRGFDDPELIPDFGEPQNHSPVDN